jgi:hypothetical protein
VGNAHKTALAEDSAEVVRIVAVTIAVMIAVPPVVAGLTGPTESHDYWRAVIGINPIAARFSFALISPDRTCLTGA